MGQKPKSGNLVDLIESRRFRHMLAQAAQMTVLTGRECRFIAYRRGKTQRDYFSPLIEGDNDSVGYEEAVDWLDDKFSEEELDTMYPALDIHFHPRLGRLPLPSRDDLNLLNYDTRTYSITDGCARLWGYKGKDIRPIMGISTINNSGDGVLLLMQRRYSIEDGREPIYILDELAHCLSTELPKERSTAIKTLTREKMFRAAFVDYRIPQDEKHVEILGKNRDEYSWFFVVPKGS